MRTFVAMMNVLMSVAVVLSSTAQAQETKPAARTADGGSHRLEIYNGPLRTVHYISVGATAGEQAALRDQERAENEGALADQLTALRRQYVNDERFLENRRRVVQERLYGYFTVNASSPYLAASPFATYPFASYAYGYPYTYGFGGAVGTTAQSLAWGVGDEGAIKTGLAQTLATPAAFRLAHPGARVIVTRKAGDGAEKIEGSVVRDSGEWLAVDTKGGTRTISKSQIIDVLEPRPEGK